MGIKRLLTDYYGLPVTTVSSEALTLYDQTVDRLFTLQPGADALIDRALALDPEFALAHCAKARARMAAGDTPAGRAAALRARELAAPLSPRERGHADIVCMVLHGEAPAAALEAVEEHAAAFPRDPVPLSFALGVYGLLGFGGFADFPARQVALLRGVEKAWGDADWWFLSSLGWALVEAGDAAAGIPKLDRALALKPDNAAAIHGRVHGCYEQGAAVEGEAFIADWLPRYDRAALLHGHLAWHQALFALQRGDAGRALSIYRESVAPDASQALPMFTMIDAAAFAMRCALYGHPLAADELGRIAAFAERHFPKPGVPFVNAHQALARALTPGADTLADWIGAVDEALADGRQASGPVVAEICHAVAALATDRFAEAGERLERSLGDLPRLGGSGAQRDVFIDLAIAAHRLAGNEARAQALAAQRWLARAGHLDEQWLARLPIGRGGAGTARIP